MGSSDGIFATRGAEGLVPLGIVKVKKSFIRSLCRQIDRIESGEKTHLRRTTMEGGRS